MTTKTGFADNLPVKLVACALVAACLILGVVGLILPIIPGLLFLVIAAAIAARHFPWIERRLRRNGALNRHQRRRLPPADVPAEAATRRLAVREAPPRRHRFRYGFRDETAGARPTRPCIAKRRPSAPGAGCSRCSIGRWPAPAPQQGRHRH